MKTKIYIKNRKLIKLDSINMNDKLEIIKSHIYFYVVKIDGANITDINKNINIKNQLVV